MKQIFRIFAIAAVALSAAACQNDINDNITPNGQESLSIEVEISESTRIALGDLEEGKRQLYFEDGDRLLVTTAWGGDAVNPENNFWFTYSSATGKFTCTAEGVGALKGQSRDVFHLVEDPVYGLGHGVLCDSEAGLDGVVMVGSTSALGESKIVMNVYPVLKYSSEHQVTFTTSKNVFGAVKSWGIGQYQEYTFPAGTDVYVPLFSSGEITLSATIKGEVIKSKTINFEKNKIYNLGTLEAKPEEPEEPEQPVEGDTGVEITINGTFADWANVTKIASYLPADAPDKNVIKTLKAYADAENIYGYVEFAMESSVLFVATFDLDNDPATGEHNWMHPSVNGELVITGGTFIEEDALYPAPFRWASYSVGTYEMVNSSEPKDIGDGLAAVEFAVARESINTLITGPNIGLGIITYGTGSPSGMMPYDGTTLVIPVE